MLTRVYQFLARSDHWSARAVRNSRRAALNLSVPAPGALVRPLLLTFVAVRSAYYFAIRVLVCEPFFKAYCTSYGRSLRTGVYLHWVQGAGRIVAGHNVTIDGKCSFLFAARYSEQPTLHIGDNTGIGHGCSFTVGREITIGQNVRIAEGVTMFDSPGHPADPAARLAGEAAASEDVRPIRIGDNVWIGRNAFIFPGVTVGENSVVAAAAVVMTDVPANTLVAGNPARQTRQLGARAAATRPAPPSPTAPSASADQSSRLHSKAFQANG